jgi:hypothetical protein
LAIANAPPELDDARTVGARHARVGGERDALELDRHLDLAFGRPVDGRRIEQLQLGRRRSAGLGGIRRAVRLVGRREAGQRHGAAREVVDPGGGEVGARGEAHRAADDGAHAEATGAALLERLHVAAVRGAR